MDFHSLRMTLSTMMAVYGMTQRSRQAQMRHSDPKLTEMTYMDLTLLPIADELARVPEIPLAKNPPTFPSLPGAGSGGSTAGALPAGANVGQRGATVGDLNARESGRKSA